MNKRLVWFIASIAAIVIIAIIATVLKAGIDASTDQPKAGPGTVLFDPETDLVPEEARCTDNRYIDSSILVVQTGNMEYRQFATAVSIPFKEETDEGVYKETSTEICGNPTELKMVLDDMMLWSGFPGAEENKAWITTIQDVIMENSLESFITKNEAGNLIVTPEFQKYAGWVNTVLLRFNAEGLLSLTSVRNWEVPATYAPGTQPIAVQASTQESKPAWVRTLRDKNGTCLYVIGFNAEDKRIETFDYCEETHVPPTTPPTSTPGCEEADNCVPPCPPGNTTPSCAPKSADPEDYVFPEGKPPVTANPVPEAVAPPVNTTQPGGGGVIDTPTNNPGTETGTTAPDATPPPTTPVTPPPNQGGDNGPGDPIGF